MAYFVSFLVLAYLVGSIPTAYWYGRYFHNIDIREHGSGNSGATNTLRVLGKKPGIVVLLIDIIKGFLLILLLKQFGWSREDQLLLGLACVIGHILPVFASFRGGKGIATSFGLILGLNPLGALICLVLFAIVVKWTKYVSLGSLLGAFSFVVFTYLRYPDEPFFPIVCAGLFILLCYTHRSNIKRLFTGSENKFSSTK